MSSYEVIIALGSVLSGAGAAISAVIAWRSVSSYTAALQSENRQSERRIWTTIVTQSARAEAIYASIKSISEDLKTAYQTLSSFSGQSNGSRLNLYLNALDQKLENADGMSMNCQKIAASFRSASKMDYENATDSLARLEANVIKLGVLLDMLKGEYSRIERQNDQHRSARLQRRTPGT